MTDLLGRRSLTYRSEYSGLPSENLIIGLLRLYRDYYPDLVVAELGINIRRSLFAVSAPGAFEIVDEAEGSAARSRLIRHGPRRPKRLSQEPAP